MKCLFVGVDLKEAATGSCCTAEVRVVKDDGDTAPTAQHKHLGVPHPILTAGELKQSTLRAVDTEPEPWRVGRDTIHTQGVQRH